MAAKKTDAKKEEPKVSLEQLVAVAENFNIFMFEEGTGIDTSRLRLLLSSLECLLRSGLQGVSYCNLCLTQNDFPISRKPKAVVSNQR